MYALGNIFFGRVSSLYNVRIAQFFFSRAAYPLLGTPVPYAHHQLSRTYFIQGDLYKAVDEGDKELEAHPTSFGTYYILGLTYGYLNLEPIAVDYFSKYIEHAPYAWAPRNDKAWLQFRAGDIDGALTTIEPVVEKEKDNSWVQNTYGTLLLNKKRYKEAKVAFLRAKAHVEEMDPDDWGEAYPGNDPRIYPIGLEAMKSSIDSNLALVERKLQGIK
jgi:tetratricopeptide (TPR) repeat protein